MKSFWEKIIRTEPEKPGSLLKETELARQEWQNALKELNNITDTHMLDHIIYKINSTERKFIGLLKQAQKEGMAAWSEQITGPETAEAKEPAKTVNLQPQHSLKGEAVS